MQIDDMKAINTYMLGQTPKSPAGKTERNNFLSWYSNLSTWARATDGSKLTEAKERRDRYNRYEHGPAMPTPGPRLSPQQMAAQPIVTSGAKPTIKRGSKGEAVKEWQRFLKLTADGDFGPKTEATTKTYQKVNNLAADGIVGPKTWAMAQSQSNRAVNQPASAQSAAVQAAIAQQAVNQKPPIPPEAAAAHAASVAAATATTVKPPPVKPPGQTIATPSYAPVATAGPTLESVKTTIIEVNEKVPLWAKITGGVIGGIALIAGVKNLQKKKRAA